MSSDDYVRHIAQKYRLAIAIAILKTKPGNLTIDQYIDQIKNDINDKNADDDINISACSDDFNMNCSDQVNVDHNYMNNSGDVNVDQNYMNQNRLSNDRDDYLIFNGNKGYSNGIDEFVHETEVNDRGNQNNGDTTHFNDEKTLSYIESQFNDDEAQVNDRETQNNDDETLFNDEETRVNDNGNERDVNTSITIFHDFEEASVINDVNRERREKMREVINVLKGDDVVTTDEVVNETQVFCDSLQSKSFNFDPNYIDLTQYYNENSGILSESIDILNNAEREYNLSYSLNNFEIQQRNIQDSESIRPEHKDTKNINPMYSQEDNTREIRKEIRKRMNNNAKNNVSNPKMAKKTDYLENNTYQSASIVTENAYKITVDAMNIASNTNLQDRKHKDLNQVTNMDEETLYTGTDTQFNTHFSPSQINNIVLDNKFIYGSKNNNKNPNMQEVCKNVQLSNSQNMFNRDTQKLKVTDKNITEKDTAFLEDSFPNNETTGCVNVIENDAEFSDIQESQAQNIIENDTASQNAQNMNLNDNTFQANATKVLDENTVKGCAIFDKTTDINSGNDNLDGDLTDKEKIPFKIIEEFNSIKLYLRRKETQHSSGYRSSQGKSSFGGSQSQSAWIGQSANSIFSYLSSCSLTTATQDLTEQISEVLGQVVDRLHDEETYPPFLEDLLNFVNETLNLVHDEENYVFDALLKKDEQIQRILLLNKSTHIQKFTIGKINNILQKLLDEISADNYEIQNINKIENLCYIFHILQNILPRYSLNCSQISTQSSQDEGILRKRDITDLWRKKWMPIKEVLNEGSLENKCVLKECSAILNKIIVGLMDGYSLIAFSALNCFNIMQ